MNLINWILNNKESIVLLATNILSVAIIMIPKLVGDKKTRRLLDLVQNTRNKTQDANIQLDKISSNVINSMAQLERFEINNELINKQLDRISDLATTINELKTQMTLLKEDLRNIKNNHMGD